MKKNGFKKEVNTLDMFIQDNSSRVSIDIERIISKILQKKYRRSKE